MQNKINLVTYEHYLSIDIAKLELNVRVIRY